MASTILKKFDHIITVNEEQKNFLEIFLKLAPKIQVIPAFIYLVSKSRATESIKKLENVPR